MAAGLGFIEFTTGDVLTAAAANGYLASQVVMVFADSAARTTAITSPQEGMISFLKDTNSTEYYSGSAWEAIGGGSSPLTTKGDLYTFDTADARLGVGANGTVLTADSGEATGLKWVAPAGGLTFIKSQTIGSGVSSVTVNDAFSTTYDNYLITIIGGSTVGSSSPNDADINIKFGATTTGYKYVGIYMKTTASTVNSFASNSAGSIGVGGASTNGMASNIYVFSPFLSNRTAVAAHTAPTHSDMFKVEYAGFLDNTTSYTSFIIAIAGVGQILTGGEIRVYGYQKS
jgi:hypothetical protein